MNKKTFQIISLIFSFLGLIYLVLSYFGLIRYFKLHIYDTETYIEKYKDLPKKKERIVVYFALDNDFKIEKLKPFLNSLLDQTMKVDDIGVSMSYKEKEKIPPTLNKILSFYGENKKTDKGNFVFPVLREPDAETKIIIVEPNNIYGEDFIQSLSEESEKNGDKIIYGDSSKNLKYGVLIKPKFFTEKICEYTEEDGKWLEKCSDGVEKSFLNYSPVYKVWF